MFWQVYASAIFGSDNQKGEEKMEELRTGEVYLVSTETSDKVDLCREPTIKSQTSDGMDNVIFSVPIGSWVILESREVHSGDGHDWYKVRFVQDEAALSGWMVGDCLHPHVTLPTTGGSSYDVTDVYYKGELKWEVAKLPADPAKGNPLSSGLLKYNFYGNTIYTTLDDWKAVAGVRYPIT
jgi:hypothetical protein